MVCLATKKDPPYHIISCHVKSGEQKSKADKGKKVQVLNGHHHELGAYIMPGNDGNGYVVGGTWPIY